MQDRRAIRREPVDEKTRLALLGAEYLTLDFEPTTDQGRKAAEEALQRVLAWESRCHVRTNKRRAALLQGVRKAVAAVLSQLALALDAGRMVYRSKMEGSFSGSPVSYSNFKAAMNALEGLGEVEHFPGFSNRFDSRSGQRKASRWRPTPALAEHLRACGIEPGTARAHFATSTPSDLLVVRAMKPKPGQGRCAPVLSIQPTDATLAMSDAVAELNAFITPDRVTGGQHEGFYRVFNAGDHPQFAWNLGGRVYARGEPSYQLLSEDARLRMRIDGEPVAEVDISGSHLTLLYGRHGIPFDPAHDPYDVPGIPRDVVKAWMVTTLGRNGFPSRWPSEHAKTLNQVEEGTTLRYPVKLITSAILQHHPVLARWPNRDEGYLRLMFLEAEIIIGTMLRLKRGHGIPSLPVHDSVLVSHQHRNIAASVLSEEFAKRAGTTPKLKIKSALEHLG